MMQIFINGPFPTFITMTDHSPLVAAYGGKAASLIAQYRAGNSDILFPFTVLEVKDIEQGKRPSFSFTQRQIVRGSAPGDEKGLVDVIRTYQNVSPLNLNGWIDFSDAANWSHNYINTRKEAEGIQDKTTMESKKFLLEKDFVDPLLSLIWQSRSPGVRQYAEWEGLKEYNGAASILIQPQNREILRGSMIEHPNMKGHHLINLVTKSFTDDRLCFLDQVLADKGGTIITASYASNRLSIDPDHVKDLVAMKRRIREAGFVPATHASQVEFGPRHPSQDVESGKYQFPALPTSPFIMYQERFGPAFDTDPHMNPENYSFNQFGKIPRGGLEVRVLKTGELMEDPSVITDGVPSAYVFNTDAINGHMHFFPNNLTAFIVTPDVTKSGNSLEHHTYRWIQEAQLSLLFQRVNGRYLYDDFKHGEMLKLKPSSSRRR